MKTPLLHVASLVYNTPLAILPEKFDEILQAIGPRLFAEGVGFPQLQQLRQVAPLANGSINTITTSGTLVGGMPSGNYTFVAPPGLVIDDLTIKAQLDDDEEEDSRPYRLTPEGIAVIPVRGTLLKRATWLSSASGLASYQGVRQAMAAALKDPMVKAVMLDIDSPGGTTHGCFELSDAIYGMRGEKPIYACSNDLAASAAYATGSAADRLFVTRTGGVGSIGVFAVHMNVSDADAQAGVEFTYIYAGAKKVDGNPHQALSKSARADVQAEVDREYNIFVATVARNRGHAGANVEKVQATEAGMKYGEMAVGMLADEVATFDQAMEALSAKVSGSPLKTSGKLALQPDSGNNAQQQPPSEDSKKEEAHMDEKKKAEQAEEANKAAAAAAKPDDPDDDEDNDDEKKKDTDDDEAKKGNKSKVAAMPNVPNAAAASIANLCMIAGAPELIADFMSKGYDVDKVIEKLNARRVKASAENPVNAYVSGEQPNPAGRPSVDQAIQQAAVIAREIAAASGGKLNQKQAMAKAMEQVLTANPAIYDAYLDERDDVIARSPSGRGAALTNYVLNNQRRYLMGMGLSGVIDDVPQRRSMV